MEVAATTTGSPGRTVVIKTTSNNRTNSNQDEVMIAESRVVEAGAVVEGGVEEKDSSALPSNHDRSNHDRSNHDRSTALGVVRHSWGGAADVVDKCKTMEFLTLKFKGKILTFKTVWKNLVN